MIDKEQAGKTLKLIVQNAWRLDTGNTTLNSMIEWILREYMEQVVMPVFEKIEEENEFLHTQISELEQVVSNALDSIRNLENGQDGSIQKPKGRPATKAKRTDTEARA